MLRAREDAEESLEHELEAPLRVLRRELGRWKLLADDELEVRDQVHYQLSVGIQSFAERIAPAGQLRFALTQKRLDQLLKGLGERAVGDVALVLIKLARCEKSARRNQRFMEFIDDRGLADTGIAGNKNQLRPAAGYYTVESAEQHANLRFAPVQFLRNQQPVWRVLFTKRELVNATLLFPFDKTAAKIHLDSNRCLIALLGRLGEQLHDDC